MTVFSALVFKIRCLRVENQSQCCFFEVHLQINEFVTRRCHHLLASRQNILITFSCSLFMRLKRYSKARGMTPLSWWVKLSSSPSAGPIKQWEWQLIHELNNWSKSMFKCQQWNEEMTRGRSKCEIHVCKG